MGLDVLADDGGRYIVNLLNVLEVIPENCVRIISNVALFVRGSCLHDNSSRWITQTPPPRPEARGTFTNVYPLHGYYRLVRIIFTMIGCIPSMHRTLSFPASVVWLL